MRGKKLTAVLVGLMVAVLGLTAFSANEDKLVAGFVYVGPVGDFGWTWAHDAARQVVDDTFPWLETRYAEAVAEAEVDEVVDMMIDDGADVIFTTSFGYQFPIATIAPRYPEIIFGQIAFLDTAPNIVRYFADLYQASYVTGLLASALAETGKIGFVAANPVPELKRNINATAIGAREINPDAEIHVRWLYSWYDPTAAKEAAEALIADGVEVLLYVEDSATVAQVASEVGIPTFGHYSNHYDFAPELVVTSKVVDWVPIYLDFLSKVYAGAYKAGELEDVFYWGLLGDGGARLEAAPGTVINPLFEEELKAVKVDDPLLGEISVYELAMRRIDQMKDPQLVFDPFDGPLYDRQGNLRVPQGSRADYAELFFTMEWAVEGVFGPWPGE